MCQKNEEEKIALKGKTGNSRRHKEYMMLARLTKKQQKVAVQTQMQ